MSTVDYFTPPALIMQLAFLQHLVLLLSIWDNVPRRLYLSLASTRKRLS